MTGNEPYSESRERLLQEAERQFGERGYTAVTLRDIADALRIKQASLYHHVPGGKEQLFIEVSERTFKRHYAGVTRAMTEAGPDVRAQLRGLADWLLSQPPMDLIRMAYSDMPAIDPAEAGRLSWLAYESMLAPIEAALARAQEGGQIKHHNLGLIAGGLLGMIESLHSAPSHVQISRQTMAYDLIDVMLDGLRSREEGRRA